MFECCTNLPLIFREDAAGSRFAPLKRRVETSSFGHVGDPVNNSGWVTALLKYIQTPENKPVNQQIFSNAVEAFSNALDRGDNLGLLVMLSCNAILHGPGHQDFESAIVSKIRKAPLEVAHRFYWFLTTTFELPAATDAVKEHANAVRERIASGWLPDESSYDDQIDFKDSVKFWQSLCSIGDTLLATAKPERNGELGRLLEAANKSFFGGDFIQSSGQNIDIPTSTAPLRVLQISPVGCFVLTSKERVPFNMLLEVTNPERLTRSTSYSRSRSGVSPFAAGAGAGDVSNRNSLWATAMKLSTFGRSTGQKDRPFREVDSDEEEAVGQLRKEVFNTGIFVTESWDDIKNRCREESGCASTPGWDVLPVIIKGGADLRQEEFAGQLLRWFARVFEEEGLRLWVKPFEIVSFGARVGAMEVLANSVSIDSMKRAYQDTSLKQYFMMSFPAKAHVGKIPRSKAYVNYSRSLAAYSVIQYVLDIRDRHNGNILIDDEGHVIHCDFGFMLTNSPGNMFFESTAFKLTDELTDVLGGSG